MKYVAKAYFIYDDDSKDIVERVSADSVLW